MVVDKVKFDTRIRKNNHSKEYNMKIQHENKFIINMEFCDTNVFIKKSLMIMTVTTQIIHNILLCMDWDYA